MDENLHKDPLEELFRKKLEDQNLEKKSAASDEWDLPADGLWDNIGPAVEFQPPAKGLWLSSRLQVIAIAASIILVIGVFTCFQSYQTQLNSLTQKVEELSSQKEQKNSTTPNEKKTNSQEVPVTEIPTNSNLTEPTLNKQDSKNKLPNAPSEASNITENIKQNSLISPSSIPNESAAERTNKPNKASIANTSGTTSPPDFTTPGEAKESVTNFQQNPELIIAEQNPANSSATDPILPVQNKLASKDSKNQANNPTINWTVLPALPAPQIAMLDNVPAIITTPNAAQETLIKPIRKLARKGFYAGLLYAPTATFIENEMPKKHPRRPKLKKEKTILTAFQGLKLGYQINSNWAIEIEGRYSNATIENKSSSQLRYSKQKERMDGQVFRGDYSSSIPTAYGDFDAEIILYREAGANIPDQTDINLELNAEQKLQLLSIPIVAKYSFGSGPIRLTARAGVAANFILEDQVELSISSIDRMGLSSRSTKFNPEEKGLGKNNLDFLLGMGLDFQAGKNWRFSLEPSFSRAFSPVYKKDKFSAIPKKASVALAVSYQF